MTEALQFLFRVTTDILVMVVLMRALLQWFRADFHNPMAQAILQLTSPVVLPLRKIIPPIGRIDTATVVAALLLELAVVFLFTWFFSFGLTPVQIVTYTLIRTVLLTLKLIVFVVFISVLLSWISPGPNPATAIIYSIAEPVLRPFRRFIPPIGGLDLSPLVALLLIMAVNIVVAQQLPYFLR